MLTTINEQLNLLIQWNGLDTIENFVTLRQEHAPH